MALKFEWDENKAELNLKKHGIAFETAVKVFLDRLLSARLATAREKKVYYGDI